MVPRLCRVDQTRRNVSLPCGQYPTRFVFGAHEHYASVVFASGPAPEEACGENSFAVVISTTNYTCGHAIPENTVDQQYSSTRSVCMVVRESPNFVQY